MSVDHRVPTPQVSSCRFTSRCIPSPNADLPARAQETSYILGLGQHIVTVTVNSAYNQNLPITDFYSAMGESFRDATLRSVTYKTFSNKGWVISITEFPPDLTAPTRYPYECQYLILGIFARWCYVLASEDTLTDQMPATASISWLILPSGQRLVHYGPQFSRYDIMAVSSTLPGRRGLAAKEEARVIRERRLTEILEGLPAAPKFKNCLVRLLDDLPALSKKVDTVENVSQTLDIKTLRKELKINDSFGQQWGHCAETLTLLWCVHHFLLMTVRIPMDSTVHISVLLQ
jgi:hypothetical protein